MKEIKDSMYTHSETLIIKEEAYYKSLKERALEAAKYLEWFCLYLKLDAPDCQGCPFNTAGCCLLYIPDSWGVTQKFPKKDDE